MKRTRIILVMKRFPWLVSPVQCTLIYFLFLPIACSTALAQEIGSVMQAPGKSPMLERPTRILLVDSGSLMREVYFSENGAKLIGLSESNEPRCLVCRGEHVTVRIWATEGWNLLNSIDVGNETAMTISHNGAMLVTGDSRWSATDGVKAGVPRLIHIWDVESGALLHTLTGHTDGVTGLAFSQDDARLISSAQDSSVRVWDVASEKQLIKIRVADPSKPAVMPDGRRFMVATDWPTGAKLKLYDLESGKEVQSISLLVERPASSLSVSPDGKRVAVPFGQWEIATGRKFSWVEQKGSSFPVDFAAFSPDGSHIFIYRTGGVPYQYDTQYHKFEIWNGEGTVLERSIRRTAGRPTGSFSVQFSLSPDGRQLAYGTDSGTIEIWDVGKGAEKASLATAQDVSDYREADALCKKGEELFYNKHSSNSDYEAALKLLIEASQKKHPRAAYLAAFLYRDGKGTPENIDETIRLSLVAVDIGYFPAFSSLITGYWRKEDYERAIMWAFVATGDAAQKEFAENSIAKLEKMLSSEQIAAARQYAMNCVAGNFRKCSY